MPLIHFVLLASSPSRCTSRSLNRSCSRPLDYRSTSKPSSTSIALWHPNDPNTSSFWRREPFPMGNARPPLHHRSGLGKPFDHQGSISLNINIAVRIAPNSAIQLNKITKRTLPIPSNSTAAVQPLEKRLIRPDS